jgi:hypothetical protein
MQSGTLTGGDLGVLVSAGGLCACVTGFWNVLDDAITSLRCQHPTASSDSAQRGRCAPRYRGQGNVVSRALSLAF